ncbi:hypothetical protein [Xanthomonas campestris]|uniref:hypothetical protein n=1 Tax=Xanthomonas campestris TaxID=339 RepID=UPI001F423216|nr:hypothetical protein [Xanthomonas campestris]MCF8795319.1 hypothetical protein [Xanthomonas campestris pv. campestris]MCF8815999.1 hypothetical protein [Xanthomonas campestris pv. campestris]WHO88946.1 hypothetical protein QMY63_01260 [Xanthomonas campestris]
MTHKKKKPAQRIRYGYCKLTGRPGAFVKSHLIPDALTKPSQAGEPLFQYGDGPKPSRRWSSWYDTELVTRAGEDILSALDTWAISVLREHKPVWSGWGDMVQLGELHTKFDDDHGIREVSTDTKKLRMFFLSLLWRAAASELYEFREIVLPQKDLEVLRKIVLGENEPDPCFYPVQLTQISTKGLKHNQAPYPDIKYIPDIENENAAPYSMKTIRFYFDGLIAHFATELHPSHSASDLGKIVVGTEPTVVLSTVTFEDSMQGREVYSVLGQYHPQIKGSG